MTTIVGGVLVIGESHGLRSGIDNPDTVLTLRRDKRTAWIRNSSPLRRRRGEPRSPHTLWLEYQQYVYYPCRNIITDALIWWGNSEKLGVDTDLIRELREFGKIGEIEGNEEIASKLHDARQQVESAELTDSFSLFISLATGDDHLIVVPPQSDLLSGLLENLRNLNIQYELSMPVASRLTPGMENEIVESSRQIDGRTLDLFSSKD